MEVTEKQLDVAIEGNQKLFVLSHMQFWMTQMLKCFWMSLISFSKC